MNDFIMTRKYQHRSTSLLRAVSFVSRGRVEHILRAVSRLHAYKDQTNALISIGITLALVLSFLYVMEVNSVLSSKRSVPVLESMIHETRGAVTYSEIQATQLQSSQKVRDMAQSADMIFSDSVTYVSLSDSSIALVK